MIRVVLPHHLRTLARTEREVQLNVAGPITLQSVLDELEKQYPMLTGTIRDHGSQQRRPLLRFFACEEDLSNEPPDSLLPDAVASGAEPLVILGAIAGGASERSLQNSNVMIDESKIPDLLCLDPSLTPQDHEVVSQHFQA